MRKYLLGALLVGALLVPSAMEALERLGGEPEATRVVVTAYPSPLPVSTGVDREPLPAPI